MNEVLCDLSASLGHEMKLKDEQNQAMLVPYPQKIFLKCARIHRNFCLQRQRTFKIPFKIKNSNFRRCSDRFIFPSKSCGRNATFNEIVAGFPSFLPPPPFPLPSPLPKKASSEGYLYTYETHPPKQTYINFD